MKRLLILSLSLVALLLSLFSYFSSSRTKLGSTEPLPDFLTAQIAENLANVRIKKSELESTWNAIKGNFGFIRYKWVNGTFAVCANPQIMNDRRYITVTESLQKVFQSHPFPNVDLILFLEDSINDNIYPCPIFAFATKGPGRNVILMPDPTALDETDRGYITKTIQQEGRHFEWSKKRESIFWRGSPTGPAPEEEDLIQDRWESSPRFHLVQLALAHPALIDAGFILPVCTQTAPLRWPYTTIGATYSPLLASKFKTVPSVHPKDHLAYKYLLDIDGNSCCYSRTYWILLSNSLMLKQVTDNRQWFYKGLQPYHQFVPVEQNLSDLFEKLEWCKSHDREARNIAKNGTVFALQYLQYDSNMQFLKELLLSYAACMEYEPALEKEDNTQSIIPLYGKIYHTIKGFLRKKMNKPIASVPV